MLKSKLCDQSGQDLSNIQERLLAVKRWAFLAASVKSFAYFKKSESKKKEYFTEVIKDDSDIKSDKETSGEDVTDEILENIDDHLTECILCLELYGSDQCFVLNSICNHEFCINCLHQYVRTEIQDGRVDIKCPQCVSPMHPDDIEILAVDGNDNSKVNMYHHLMVQRVLVHDPDTRWCPAPDCMFGVIATDCKSCPKIGCGRQECNTSFCYHCRERWEDNHQCGRVGAKDQQQLVVLSGDINLRGCPRCSVLVEKMDDGSCNHMHCSVCGCEFCWLCMKEITSMHYLSPSGCTFWGKKKWTKKKKVQWQLGVMIGAPVGIVLFAGISIPGIVIGFPVDVGRKLYRARNKNKSQLHRTLVVTSGVTASILVSPILASLAVSVGVTAMLGYTYVVLPISLYKSIVGENK